MDEAELKEIKARLEGLSGLPWRLSKPGGMYVLAHGSAVSAILHTPEHLPNREFVAHAPEDVRRLVAEVRLLRSLASDCARWQEGEAAGRLQSLKWAMRHKRPSLRMGEARWWPGTADSSCLEPSVFALLEDGVNCSSGGRVYPSVEAATADLAQALVRLARKGFPGEDKP